MIKHIIFDLDGTLVNSIYDLGDSVNNVLKRNGYPIHDYEKYYYFVGNGTVKLCERALPVDKRTQKEIEKIHSEFQEEYKLNYKNKTRSYDGIEKMLTSLSDMNIKYSVASNKTDRFSKIIVSELLKDNNFSYVYGKKEGYKTKPDPQLVYDIIENENLKKSEVLFVGDSNVDIKTGHNAGIKSVGCLWGFRDYDELQSAGADYIIKKPEELLEIVKKL